MSRWRTERVGEHGHWERDVRLPGRPREVSDVWTWIAVGLFLAAWIFFAG
jgi:hypothetical protein